MLSWWLILLLLVYFGVCGALIFIILIQSGKGGGLSSLAQSSTQISDALGVTSAERTLNKITTYIAICFGLFAIGLSIITSMRGGGRTASDVLSVPAAQATPIVPSSAQPGVPAGDSGIIPAGDVPPPDPGGAADTVPPPVAPQTGALEGLTAPATEPASPE